MINPNEPAFPELQGDHDKAGDIYYKMSGGLTKREYMAIQFMAASIQKWGGTIPGTEAAEYAVRFADELIAELNKTTTE